jgi:ATP-dependent DNA helicase RecG
MITDPTKTPLLVADLLTLSRETEWLEFKHNKADATEIGQYISALANAAALAGKPTAYLIWGIDDATRKPIGTTFKPFAAKGTGNEDLHNWLTRLLTPKLAFTFAELTLAGLPVVLLAVPAATSTPVSFQGQEFIRVGANKKALKDLPEHERRLWRSFDATPFEQRLAAENLARDEVLARLHYPAYFDLLKRPLPPTPDAMVEALAADQLLVVAPGKRWHITNLGAMVLAKDLSDFPTLARKTVRVVTYEGASRVRSIQEHVASGGYAVDFQALIASISSRLPSNEVIEKAIRKVVPMYPELAVRELVANALIHQEFSISGSGPMIEIFADRMEITNPGEPLIAPNRFLDLPPRSRNERFASLMRQFGICEERGSGVDKVVSEIEFHQLPAPLFEVVEGSTRAVLFAPQPLNQMDKAARIRACYLHACLRYVSHSVMSNASLRERFGVEEKNKATVSRLIREAVDSGAVQPQDANAAPKMMRYVPFWAAPAGS